MLHPVALHAQKLTKGSDKSCTEELVNSVVLALLLAEISIPSHIIPVNSTTARGNILLSMLQKTLPCLIHSFYYFIYFSKFV